MSNNRKTLKPIKSIFSKGDCASLKYNPYNKSYVRTFKQRQQKKQSTRYIQYSSHQPLDNEWVGDNLGSPPSRNHTRFWLQNCQGMITARDINQYHYETQQYLDKHIHYMAFTETRINPYHTQTVYEIEHGYTHLVSHGRIDITNTPGYPSTSAYQPGGVAAAFYGRLANRYTKTVRDKAGRWIMHEFVGKQKPLRAYTLYRVNPKSGKADLSSWAQQKRYLQQNNVDSDPRTQVIDDILNDIELSIQNGCSVILMADLNEHVTSREKTNKKLYSLGLHNVMQAKLNTDILPRTHRRGCQAIDHVWVTASLLHAIPKAGFAPFDYLGTSDHRGLCFDVDLEQLLDFNIIPLQSMPHRRLQSQIPKRVKKYMEVLSKKWNDFNIDARLQQINENIRHGALSTLEKDLNNLDQNINDAMRHAERKCCGVPGRVSTYWSPTYHNALRNLHRTRTKRNKSQYMIPGESIIDAVHQYNSAQKEYETALKTYREVKGKDAEIRKLDMTQLAEDRAENKNSSTSVEYNKILHHESDSRSHRKIKYVVKPDYRSGVTSILVPAKCEYPNDDDDFDHLDVDNMWTRITPSNGKNVKEWERITEKSEIERILLRWQQLHFLQANETPLASPSWKQHLDDPQFQEEVIHGRYNPPAHLHETTRDVLLHFQRDPNVTEFEFSTTFDEFKHFIKISKERTGTSPSGRHYGHYKALLQSGTEYMETIHAVLEIALQHNIILRRWRNTTTTLIEKEPGLPYVHRMRAIHIIEAEVQFLAKNFYVTKLMSGAEKKELITDEQYGGRAKRQAQSAVINKIMYYNLSHQMLLPAAFMDDDARACYDRIITPLSSLECRKWGAPYRLASFTNNFIESQTYSIKTGHGISDGTYSYNSQNPIQGSGQGIGWAGPRWLCSGDTCSRIMAKSGTGMLFNDPSYSIKVKKQGDYFVDDTATGVTINTLRQDQKDLFDQLNFIEQLHSDILFSLGHKLAIDKCSFYAADYVRGKLKHEHKLIHELPGCINIRETHDSSPISVKRLQPFQAHKTLGCNIALNYNQGMQFRVLHKKLEHWNSKVKSSFLTASEKIKSYNAYTSKGVEYVLPTSSMSQKQCAELDKLVTPILYHAHSIQKNNSKCILYAPEKYGGFGHKDVWHLQGLNKLKFFFAHYRRHDTTGRLIKISMRWTQLEAGVSKPFYTYHHQKLAPILTPTWVTHMWEYLSSCNSTIREHSPWIHKTTCSTDFFLMDEILLAAIPMEHKIIFNEIRMHLQLLTAADIVLLGTGNTIIPSIFNGFHHRKSSLQWPDTKPFPKRWLKIWRTLMSTYIQPKLRNTPLDLNRSLGHQTWTTFTSHDSQYINFNGIMYRKHGATRSSNYLPTTQTVECCNPADIIVQNEAIMLLGHRPTIHEQHDPQPALTAWDFYTRAPRWQKQIWGNAPITKQVINDIEKHMMDDNINCAGDGSIKRGKAAHAWCIFRKDTHEILLKGTATVNGDYDHITSLRPETISCIAAGSFLNLIAAQHERVESHITFYSDNKAAVTNSARTNLHDIGIVLENDIDVTVQNVRLLQKAKFNFRMEHVHGHQDDHSKDLSPIANINVQMDELVGQHIEQLLTSNIDTSEAHFFPSQQISLVIDGKCTHTCFEDALIYQYYKKDLIRHYANVVKLDPNEFHNVRWNALRLALRHCIKSDQKLKAIHSQWQTKYICRRWKLTEDAICPICHDQEENWQHVLRCPNIHMSRVRNESIIKLKQELFTLKTNPHLQDHIMNIVTAWTMNDTVPTLDHSFVYPIAYIRDAHQKQCQIGYDQMIKGLLTPAWGNLQELDYDKNKLPANYNKIRWEKTLISTLQSMLINMWNERCKIVNAANSETHEQRYRQEAWEFLCNIKENKWQVTHDSLHLLDRDEGFFKYSTLDKVQGWYNNIQTAVGRGEVKHKGLLRDIRKFFVREEGFVRVKHRMRSLNDTAQNELNRVKNTIQQNLSNIFRSVPSLGR